MIAFIEYKCFDETISLLICKQNFQLIYIVQKFNVGETLKFWGIVTKTSTKNRREWTSFGNQLFNVCVLMLCFYLIKTSCLYHNWKQQRGAMVWGSSLWVGRFLVPYYLWSSSQTWIIYLAIFKQISNWFHPTLTLQDYEVISIRQNAYLGQAFVYTII